MRALLLLLSLQLAVADPAVREAAPPPAEAEGTAPYEYREEREAALTQDALYRRTLFWVEHRLPPRTYGIQHRDAARGRLLVSLVRTLPIGPQGQRREVSMTLRLTCAPGRLVFRAGDFVVIQPRTAADRWKPVQTTLEYVIIERELDRLLADLQHHLTLLEAYDG